MPLSDATLLLIGHGSTVNGDSGATVHQHAAELRRRGLFADVRVAFFKIEPHIGPALAEIRTPRIFVVPLFVSEGWFTRQAIPCELGLPAGSQDVMPCTVRMEGRDVIYCHPVGTHPLMTEIILARAEGVLKSSDQPTPCPSQSLTEKPVLGSTGYQPVPSGYQPDGMGRAMGIKPGSPLVGDALTRSGRQVADRGGQVARATLFQTGSQEGNSTTASAGEQVIRNPQSAIRNSTALIIAGHGTSLNPDSRKSIERQVELIAARNMFAEVHPAFLEEDPRIADIPRFVRSPRIVVVPFFMSDGLHVCEDIPVLLGENEAVVQQRLKAGEWPWRNPTERAGKTIFYTPGVGSEPGIADVILERVRAAAPTT